LDVIRRKEKEGRYEARQKKMQEEEKKDSQAGRPTD
jgi:hypothetical protein